MKENFVVRGSHGVCYVSGRVLQRRASLGNGEMSEVVLVELSLGAKQGPALPRGCFFLGVLTETGLCVWFAILARHAGGGN